MKQTRLRITKQRQLIMDELKKDFSHPTAYEVYLLVRPKMPNISLGTVYRNLELLSDCGLIQKIELTGSRKRFDGAVNPHYHVRCVRCGRVDDVPLDSLQWLQESVQTSTDYEILSHRLEFEGVCPACRAERESS